MRTRVSTKGQIVLPTALRAQDGVAAGDVFEIQRLEEGTYQLTRVSRAANAGLVGWLFDSPEKGWFTSIESESTGNE
jgi:AbrB family looped-hinge helix DNA binding protein